MLYALVGASWALTLTFVIAALAWRSPKFTDGPLPPPPRRAWVSVMGVRAWVLGYMLVTFVGGFVFGPRWFDRADPFDVYSAVVAHGSPLVRAGRWQLHNPLRTLAAIPVDRGLVAVVAVLLGSTA